MVKKICPECGSEQGDLAKYCKDCGAPLFGENESSQNTDEDTVLGSDEKICPECGFKQSIESNFCKNCGTPFGSENTEDDALICTHCGCELHTEEYCPDCGYVTGIKICPQCKQKSINENYCPVCGYRLNSNVKTCRSCGKPMDIEASVCSNCGAKEIQKNPLAAFVLSLVFPGLGQLYNGQNRKGVTLIIAYVIAWILSLILVGIVLAILIWIYGMYDAFTSAKAINRGEPLEDKVF